MDKNVIPIYFNEESLDDLLELEILENNLRLEITF